MSWTPEVKFALDKVFASEAKDRNVVFDADGTLWHDDIGEGFFRYQIENKLAPGIANVSDPMAVYRDLSNRDAPGSCGWLAQINAGLADAELHAQSLLFYQTAFKDRINDDMRELIKAFKAKGFRVYICTASIKWALAPAVLDLGLTLDDLIAVEVKLDADGRLTDQLVEPIPYRGGKKFWVEKKLSEKPLLVAGNSMGDLEMMTLATELPLAIVFKPHLEPVRKSEEALLLEAAKRKWIIQIFQS